MTNMLPLVISVIAALITSGLFLYGLWQLCSSFSKSHKEVISQKHVLARDESNPILKKTDYPWEGVGVMNPAAVFAGGLIHLFYRAIGHDGISRIGYAASEDGVDFSDRLPYPVFSYQEDQPGTIYKDNNPRLIASGGTWVGTEDPRAVLIDGRVYLTFSAFSGWNSLRMGVTSISVEDLLQKKWRWSKTSFLSPVGQVHKNWVLFPEKIHGKYAVLHSLHSGSRDMVIIDYLDSLDVADPIESPYNPVHKKDVWDSKLRGAGPPPIRTAEGWLVLYHAIDEREPSKYKLGAMLLDLENPTKVLARSNEPVLSPDASYENEGFKPGIVYACGAVAKDAMLRVYYGGADEVVCTASATLADFIAKLTSPKMPLLTLSPV